MSVAVAFLVGLILGASVMAVYCLEAVHHARETLMERGAPVDSPRSVSVLPHATPAELHRFDHPPADMFAPEIQGHRLRRVK